jgi:hypothetical protein
LIVASADLSGRHQRPYLVRSIAPWDWRRCIATVEAQLEFAKSVARAVGAHLYRGCFHGGNIRLD